MINIDNNSEINYYHSDSDQNNCKGCIDILFNSIVILFTTNKLHKNLYKLANYMLKFDRIGSNAIVLEFH